MGSCFSTDNAAGAGDQPPTAKVVTLAGSLREYRSPLTAADALADDGTSCFLCDADKLFPDDYIPPLDPAEPLRAGGLYFVLPAAKLGYPLSGDDMRELVVRASSALALASEKGGWKRKNKEEEVKVVPVLEVDNIGQQDGPGDMGAVGKCDDDGVSLGRRPVAVHRKMKRSGSVRGRVGFPCRYSSGARLGTIPEVVEWSLEQKQTSYKAQKRF